MKKYSPCIKKHYKVIEESGYVINENGSQISKHIGHYEVLITDLSVKSLFTKIKTVLVWIKNKETRTIEVEKLYKHEILPLPFHKINIFVNETIAEVRVRDEVKSKNQVQKVARNIDLDISKPKTNIREISVYEAMG